MDIDQHRWQQKIPVRRHLEGKCRVDGGHKHDHENVPDAGCLARTVGGLLFSFTTAYWKDCKFHKPGYNL